MEQALRQVVERARVEAAAGAPGPMVAVYVEAEAEHLIAGHTGDEANCNACLHRATASPEVVLTVNGPITDAMAREIRAAMTRVRRREGKR